MCSTVTDVEKLRKIRKNSRYALPPEYPEDGSCMTLRTVTSQLVS
jgi:hypothetical protein